MEQVRSMYFEVEALLPEQQPPSGKLLDAYEYSDKLETRTAQQELLTFLKRPEVLSILATMGTLMALIIMRS